MKLTEQQFTEALAGFRSDQSQIALETRGRPRVPVGARATIVPVTELGRRDPATVVVLNVSETGVAILHTEPLRAGDAFILDLPVVNGQPRWAVLCTVMHSNAFATGLHSIGAKFTRVMPAEIEKAKGGMVFQQAAEVSAEDEDHLRSVESRISQLGFEHSSAAAEPSPLDQAMLEPPAWRG